MKAKQIALILIPLNIILAYFVFNSIDSEVLFNREAKIRISENVQKLKDLRQVQTKYKQAKGTFADNFESLTYFLENDSISIVKAIGEIPDTLTEEQALKLVDDKGEKIIIRDTAYVLAKETVFDAAYLESRNENFPLDLNNLTTVPHSNEVYNIDAGQVEKGKVIVQVFEISTNYAAVFSGLDAENKSYELDALLKVGSMSEASLNGNWKSE